MTTILSQYKIEQIINTKISKDDYSFFLKECKQGWGDNDMIYYFTNNLPLDKIKLEYIQIDPFCNKFSIKIPKKTYRANKYIEISNVYDTLCNKNIDILKNKLKSDFKTYKQNGMTQGYIDYKLNEIMININKKK